MRRPLSPLARTLLVVGGVVVVLGAFVAGIWVGGHPTETGLNNLADGPRNFFLGPSAPAVLGDYASGANHVLPTGGLARGAGGLGVEEFLKGIQIVSATPDGLEQVRGTIGALAAAEGLPLHAAAVEARFREVVA